VACAEVPPVAQSREALWSRFGNQPVDNLLMTWGAPSSETHLTDGSRLLTYEYNTIYDAASPYERRSGCKVSFLAHPPKFLIGNIALEGSANECHQLALGRTGDNAIPYVPMPNEYTPPLYPYHHYPF